MAELSNRDTAAPCRPVCETECCEAAVIANIGDAIAFGWSGAEAIQKMLRAGRRAGGAPAARQKKNIRYASVCWHIFSLADKRRAEKQAAGGLQVFRFERRNAVNMEPSAVCMAACTTRA